LFAPAAVAGICTWSWQGALEVLLWAGLVRMFTVHHFTWAINSLAHLWGARPFRTGDHSVDVAWLAIPSVGEAWHNGHHAFPSSARFGHAWWQLDLGFLLIRGLEAVGLVWSVKLPSASALGRARAKQ
jgi:stearoyl-CoA desaturase (Delta-9 desaturase)